MMFKHGIGMLALAAVVSSRAIPIVPRQLANIDIDSILNEMEEQYKDPAFAHQFASAALAYASAAIPEGEKVPSEEELYAQLATMDTKIVPSLLSDALNSIDAALDGLNLNPAMASQVSEAMSALHNTSVMSRLNTLFSNLLQNISEEQEEGNIGTPTSISKDDSKETGKNDSAVEENDSVETKSEESVTESKTGSETKDDKDNKDEDNNDDDTGIASGLTAGAYVISVAVSLGTMAALF
ncbi:hypothetical protein COEREDRAFT_82496 [Coemansia reversa NRRL 1564]|uniref:Uncharacterized protein n=1 Tax=Coemansia reversa (strain ATCC 12441 / NRRL 1564) TaxID=763665 RepID=A0A2G5B6T6_COERN|nr:hypothetical protein COEREDRAFT_82496 [Coemansia reversa NRRL 1564]|eukprot:PIA14736.1 hypothetical protein COEREDRAFT_82496 [Coemansia reversa NRRL 1564]